jgi:predicted acylesterase/phospholipase RssA
MEASMSNRHKDRVQSLQNISAASRASCGVAGVFTPVDRRGDPNHIQYLLFAPTLPTDGKGTRR